MSTDPEVIIHDCTFPGAVHILEQGDGWTIELHGWGGDRNKHLWPRGSSRWNCPHEGDYLKLSTTDPNNPSYYRIDEMRKYGDPPDMWWARCSFIPGSKMKALLDKGSKLERDAMVLVLDQVNSLHIGTSLHLTKLGASEFLVVADLTQSIEHKGEPCWNLTERFSSAEEAVDFFLDIRTRAQLGKKEVS